MGVRQVLESRTPQVTRDRCSSLMVKGFSGMLLYRCSTLSNPGGDQWPRLGYSCLRKGIG
jgi:hypothetical protein